MILALVAMLGLSALPLVVALANLRLLHPPEGIPRLRVSLLIPARNEEANIAAAVAAALANHHPDFEVVVLDDHSTDGTARIVRAMAETDGRLRLEAAPALPPGWCGKQHACHVLAERATGDLLVFVDADVTLAPDALARIDGFISARPDLGLASGVPRQIAGTLGERLTVPLIDFLLLGFLPLWLMRRRPHDPALAAGCGQLMAVRREAYFLAGGHAAIRTTMHDGLKLPRLLRRAGLATDLFDGTTVAACRMYRGWNAVWSGFGKNAAEGMATWRALPFWTILLAGGQVLPFPVAAACLMTGVAGMAPWIALAACAAVYGGRIAIARRVGDPWPNILLHPCAILAVLAIQWAALGRAARGGATTWRGRSYTQ